MGIDIQTLFVSYAILNLSIIFIFVFFLFSIKERSDALILYIVTCIILSTEWFILGTKGASESPLRLILSNGVMFLGIGYSFYSLIIANRKFHLREFIRINIAIFVATALFSLFINRMESIRIAAASFISGFMYLGGSVILFQRRKVSRLQAWVAIFALLLSFTHFYRIYYALKIDTAITLFEESTVNAVAFILFFVENLSVGIIVLMIHYEGSKQKMESHNQLLLEVNTTRDKILSVIAHDLKNYFNALLGLSSYLSFVEDNETIGSQRKKINLINGVSNSAYLLLSNLLEWANSKRNKIVFQPKLFIIEDLIKQVVEACKPEAEIKELSISLNSSEDIEVCADQNMIRTVLRNLLFNAIKYSYRNSRIEINLKVLGKQAMVEVVDNGMGMSSAELMYLRNEETISSKPGTEKEQGNGLGLQICKEFIKLHDSKLEIESRLKAGSRFWFYLPTGCNS